MKKIILLTLLSLATSTMVVAQKKKDLLAEIDQLRAQLSTTKSELHESRKKEKVNQTQVTSMERQVADLKESNTSLLANMSSFADLSKQKAQNLESSLESIKQKDLQLKTINDALTNGDSMKLATLTIFKNAIGGDSNDAKLSLKNGAVSITMPNTFLFGSNDKSMVLTEAGKATLGKIATALNSRPELSAIVEGNSNALSFKDKKILDNWDLSARQAAAVVRALQIDFKVAPKSLEVVGKSEYNTSGIETATQIIIDPKYDAFYSTVKGSMKN